MWSILFQLVYVALYLAYIALLLRFVMSWVLQLSRRWEPVRGSAAALEVVWSVTDPPLRALRRVIPSVRIGTVRLDLSALVLLVILIVLMNIVRVAF